jgi:hypothetical protein
MTAPLSDGVSLFDAKDLDSIRKPRVWLSCLTNLSWEGTFGRGGPRLSCKGLY